MSKELKVGLLTIAAILIFVFGYQYLKGSKVFSKEHYYYAVYDNVEGLFTSNPIFLNGIQVGRISNVARFRQGNASKAIVTMEIHRDVELPVDSRAVIYAADLLGEKSMKIAYGKSSTFAKEDDTLSGVYELGMIENLGANITPLLGHIDTLVANLNTIVDKNAKQDNLQEVVRNLAVLTRDLPNIAIDIRELLESDKSKLNTTLGNLESITGNIKNDNKKIDNILTNFSSFSDTLTTLDLKSTVATAKLALNNINVLIDTINHGNGTLHEILKDPKLYNNLEAASKNLDVLLKDVKENPGRYVHLSLWKVDRTGTPADRKKKRQESKKK